ncbi:MAG: polysaccharide lyase family 1 protein [Paludibacteraceae bacterium]
MSFLFLFLACTLASVTQAATPAFPTAEGYGKYASGGRGGKVFYVTRLDDCSDDDLVEGTLRWALRSGDDTPRTVLFRVCGTIYLTSKLKLQHPNITIAGQTAPGGGICIAGANIYVCRPNVIIRHIRFRAGDIPNSSYPCLDVENTRNVIIDHCSFSWSMEECLTLYDADSTTVQWSIFAEGLYNSKNNKGSRSYAMQWGGEHATLHHCLIANCHNRTPRFNGVRDEADLANGKHNHDAQVDNEFLNNVIFNFGKKNSLYGGENDTTKNRDVKGTPAGYNRVYMVGNYFRCGPLTFAANLSQRYFVQGSRVQDYGQWLLSGNMFETGNKYNATNRTCWTDENLQLVNNDNLYGYTDNNSLRAFNLDGLTPSEAAYNRYVLSVPLAESGIVATSAQQAFEDVLSHSRAGAFAAGAALPRYDEQDLRVLDEAAGRIDPQFAGKTQPKWFGIIDSQNDIRFAREDYFYVGDSVVGGYPFLDAIEGDSLASDTDLDGLPDHYETVIGLNPEDPADAALPAANGSGYTYLEQYLNGVADGTINKAQYEDLPYVSQQPAKPLSVPQTDKSSADGGADAQKCYDLLGRALSAPPAAGHIYIHGNAKHLR